MIALERETIDPVPAPARWMRRPGSLERAIDLLEGHSATKFGDIVETASGPIVNSSPVNT